MSIGPTERKEFPINPGALSRLNQTAKKVVENFFNRPAHFIFYGSLTATLIALFVDKPLSWQYWFLFLFIGILKFSQSMPKNHD